MALNRSDKSRILRRYFPGMTRNSEMSTEPSSSLPAKVATAHSRMKASWQASHSGVVNRPGF